MPANKHDDGEEDEKLSASPQGRFKEFDCPGCSANNPVDPPFVNGDELLCNYCGSSFTVKVSDEGRVKFREL
ncbi:MAG TPA: hypothetical protein VEY30_05465 [Myxococcaceae bacterium]|nr:hypothetical protein [Myxococcaceae bacterium]